MSGGVGALAIILDRGADGGIRRRGPDADSIVVRGGRIDVVAHPLLVQVVAWISRQEVAWRFIERGRPSGRRPIRSERRADNNAVLRSRRVEAGAAPRARVASSAALGPRPT